MSLFKFDEEAAGKNGSGKGFKSGVTPAKVTGLFVGTSKAGNSVIDVHVENELGGKAIVFEVISTPQTKTGKNNPFYSALMELAYFTGVRQGTVGKAIKKVNGVDVQADCLAEATGKNIKIGLQKTYDVNPMNNKEKVYWTLNKTFSASGQNITSAREGIKRDDSATYKIEDYYTPAWKAAKANGTLIKEDGNTAEGNTPDTTTEGATAAAPTTGKLF